MRKTGVKAPAPAQTGPGCGRTGLEFDVAQRICSAIDGCEKPARSLGLCQRHYYLLRTYGTTTERRRYPPLQERFWAKVDKTGECWNWTAGKNRNGYGVILIDGRSKRAHRISYELAHGPIPTGMQVDHLCHNRSCVNPAHLRPATNKQQQENLSGPQANNKSSGILGVSWSPSHKSWVVHVGHNGKQYFGGHFKSLADAEAAAIALRLRLFTHNDLDRRSAC